MHAALRVFCYIIGITIVIVGLVLVFSGNVIALGIGILMVIVSIYWMNKVRKNSQISDIQHRLRRLEGDKK